MTIPVGKKLDGRYEVGRVLGRGGMGVVYEAHHVGLDRKVALKLILAGEADEPGIARFRREAKVASKVSHEHVVQIYDVGADEAGDFIVMELVDGESLQDLVNRGRLDPERAIALAVQMLEGLAAIHEAGIVHRDVKPSNVMLANGDADHVKLMDFGISKAIVGSVSATITKTGQVIGTPQYMAPEQVAGIDADHRADIYAVGLTLFAMLTGETPYGDVPFTELVAIKLRDPAPSLARHRIGLPQGLVAAVKKSLEREPFHRYHTAGAFAAALLAVDLSDVEAESTARTVRATPAGQTPSAKEIAPTLAMPTDPPAPRRRLPWILAVLVLGIGATIAAVLAFRSESAMSTSPARPIDAGSVVVTVDAAPDLRATAQLAERQGQLELALATYLQAFDATPDANIMFRIGELNERLDRRVDAAAAFERYLAMAPSAADATTTTARIQRLRGVTAPDARVASSVAKPPDAKPAEKPAGNCVCIVDNVAVWGPVWMCRTLAPAPTCRCESIGRKTDLCPAPFVSCNGCKGAHRTIDGVGYNCDAEPNYRGYHRSGNEGDACTGYDVRDVKTVADPQSAPSQDGKLECQACSKDFAYSGATGDVCMGYVRTGAKEPGHLDCNPKRGK